MTAALAAFLWLVPTSLPVGEWAEFELSRAGASPSYLRMAVVGREGEETYVELELAVHRSFVSPLSQARVLFSGGKVTRAWIALGVSRPEEVSPALVQRFFAVPSWVGGPPPRGVEVKRGPSQRLLTPAGTLSAYPIESHVGKHLVERVWISPTVPILNMARWEVLVTGHRAEVIALGTGAKGRLKIGTPTGEPPS